MSKEKSDETPYPMKETLLSSIEKIVASGKAVVSADDSTIVTAVFEAIKRGRTATFYLSRSQFRTINRLYWTPRRIKEYKIEAVSNKEKQRIVDELGVEDSGDMYSNRIQCDCGGVYGAFEFVEQGIREHGKEMVSAVLNFQETAVLRVNPSLFAICADCNRQLLSGHHYTWGTSYGCCIVDDYSSGYPGPGSDPVS